MGDTKRLFRDYQSLTKCLDSAFDHQILLEDDALNTDTLELKFTVRPNAGLYKDCEIEFKVVLECYPRDVPTLKPVSVVCHPNIAFEGEPEICLNILDEWDEYEDEYKSLELLIQGVLFLFHQPNFEDALAVCATCENMCELEKLVEETKRGNDHFWPGTTFDDIYKGMVLEEAVEKNTEIGKDILEIPEMKDLSIKESESQATGETPEEFGELEKPGEGFEQESTREESTGDCKVAQSIPSALPHDLPVPIDAGVAHEGEDETIEENSSILRDESDKSFLHLANFAPASSPSMPLRGSQEVDAWSTYTSMTLFDKIFRRLKRSFNTTLRQLKKIL